MNTLDRYLASRLAGAFLLSLVALCLGYIGIDIVAGPLQRVLDQTIPVSAMAGYYAARVPGIVTESHLAGLSMLIAVLYVYGVSARRNEIVAMLAAGVSIRRQAAPALLFGLLVSVAQLAVDEWVTPPAERFARQYAVEYFTSANRSLLSRESVSWANLAGGWTCHITKYNRLARTGEGVFMLSLGPERDVQVRANRIYWDEDARHWVLEDGSRAVFTPQPGVAGKPGMSEYRITQEPAPLKETPEDLFRPFEDPALFSTSELPEVIEAARDRRVPVQSLEMVLHSRLARATLPLISTLIGVSLTAGGRRTNRSQGALIAFALVLGYQISYVGALGLGEIGRLSPIMAAWSASAVFLGVSLLLFQRAPT